MTWETIPQTSFAGHRQGSTFKQTQQFQRIWETLINTVTRSPETEPKVAKKFKTMSSIPIQIWSSKNDKSQIHQNNRMLLDLNPSTCSSLVIFINRACERQVYFLQQGWDKLWKWPRLEKISKMKVALTTNLDIYNLKSNFLRQHIGVAVTLVWLLLVSKVGQSKEKGKTKQATLKIDFHAHGS